MAEAEAGDRVDDLAAGVAVVGAAPDPDGLLGVGEGDRGLGLEDLQGRGIPCAEVDFVVGPG